MNPEDVQLFKDLVYFQMQMLQLNVKMQGMIAENMQRQALGQSMAYVETDFVRLVDDYQVYHNAFPFRAGG